MDLSSLLTWLWETLGFAPSPAIETNKIKPSFPSRAPADVSASSANTSTTMSSPSPSLVDAVETTASHSTSTCQDSLWNALLSQCTPENLLLAGCVLVLGGGLYGLYRWYTQPPAAPGDVPVTPVAPSDVIVPAAPSESLLSSTASFPSTGPVGSTSTFQDSLWNALLSQCTTENLLLAGFILGLAGFLGIAYWWLSGPSKPPASGAPIVEPIAEPIAEPIVETTVETTSQTIAEPIGKINDIVFSKNMTLHLIDDTLLTIGRVQKLLHLQVPEATVDALKLTAIEKNALQELAFTIKHQHLLLNWLTQSAAKYSPRDLASNAKLGQSLALDQELLRKLREHCALQGEEFFASFTPQDKYFFLLEFKLLGPAIKAFKETFTSKLVLQAMATEPPVEVVLAPLLQSSQSLLLTVLLSLGLLRCTGNRRLSAPRVTLSLGGLGLSLATTTLLLSLGQTLLLSLVVAVALRLVVLLLLRRRCAWFRQT